MATARTRRNYAVADWVVTTVTVIATHLTWGRTSHAHHFSPIAAWIDPWHRVSVIARRTRRGQLFTVVNDSSHE